ncbi:Lethal(2) giant larvae protein [Trichostrongylus colubriformis]|uniref:Lethal(2) giant larvae protein n=1 Tax=Trichostrongylus colubriformis TaxID=6319 RepID=A0AAN8F3Y0_TRICO
MQLLFVIDTRKEFSGYVEEESESLEKKVNDCETDSSDDEFQMTNEWPPFKKVGEYDPFCDEAGLSIQRIAFDEKSGHIIVGCRGGHVLVYSLEEDEKELTPLTLNVELYESSKLPVAARNREALLPRRIPKKYFPGYQPYTSCDRNKSVLVQLQPALAVSAVASISSRHLVAASNEYGFAVIDMNKQTIILQNSLVNHSDIHHVGTFDDALSRFKSMKKSIRQTFRRKKKTPVTSLDNTIGTMNSELSTKESAGHNISKVFSDNEDDEIVVAKPVERLIEERGACPRKMIHC